MRIKTAFLCLLFFLAPLAMANSQAQPDDQPEIMVLFKTTAGDFKVRLYNGTPIHRDNFVRLVEEHYYDSLLFHRVVRDFMVQAGDPESRNAERFSPLGNGGPGYTLPAEFNTEKYFHRRGALCAARKTDQANPDRRSSGSQFYIVTGQQYRSYQLHGLEDELNEGQRQKTFNRLWAMYADSVMSMELRNDEDGKYALRKSVAAMADSVIALEGPIKFGKAQMDAYMNVGGTPNLDGDYTVFGQVTEGMKTIDKIERVMVDMNDRPLKDIRIISAQIITE